MTELPEEIEEMSLSSVESIINSRINESYSQEFTPLSSKKLNEHSLEYSYNFDELGQSDSKTNSFRHKIIKSSSPLQASGYSDDFEQSEFLQASKEKPKVRPATEQSKPIYADVVKEILRLNQTSMPVSINDAKKYTLFLKKKRASDRRSEYVKELMISRQTSEKLRNDIVLRDNEIADLRNKSTQSESSLTFLKENCNRLRDDVSSKSKDVAELTEKYSQSQSECQNKLDELNSAKVNYLSQINSLELDLREQETLRVAAEIAHSKLESRVALREKEAMDIYVSRLPAEISKRIEIEEARIHELEVKLQEKERYCEANCRIREDEVLSMRKRQEEEIAQQWSRMLSEIQASKHDLDERKKNFESEMQRSRHELLAEGLGLKQRENEIVEKQIDLESNRKRLDDDLKQFRMELALSEPTIRSSRIAMERLRLRENELDERESDINRRNSEISSTQSRLMTIGQELGEQKAQVIQKESQLSSLRESLRHQVETIKQERLDLSMNRNQVCKQEIEVSNQMKTIRGMMKMMKGGDYGGRNKRGLNHHYHYDNNNSDSSSSLSSKQGSLVRRRQYPIQELDGDDGEGVMQPFVPNDEDEEDDSSSRALDAMQSQINQISDPVISLSSSSSSYSSFPLQLPDNRTQVSPPTARDFESLRLSKKLFGY